MSYYISDLKQPRLRHASEVGDIGKVVQNTPPRSEFPKSSHPYTSTLVKAPL